MKLTILVIIIFLLKICEALFPFRHGDALYYHLPFAKFFYLHGFRAAHTEVCGALQTGLFDYFYALIYPLFAQHAILFQQVAQLAHFLFSQGIASVLTWFYLRRFHPLIALGGALSLLLFQKGPDFFLYAKNDGVPAMLALLSAIILIEHPHLKRRHVLLFTLTSGAMSLVKLSGLFTLVPLNLLLISQHYRRWPMLLMVFAGQFLMLLPLLIRNYYFVGNPFFPGFLTFLPGEATASMIKTYTPMLSAAATWKSLLALTNLFFLAKIIFPLILIALIYNFRHGHTRDNWYFYLSLASAGLYFQTNGGVVAERFIFPSFFLNNFFLFKTLANIFAEKVALWTPRHQKIALGLLLVLILLDAKIDIKGKRLRALWSYRHLTRQEIILATTPKAHAWEIIQSTSPIAKVISDQWTEFYYAPNNIRLYPSNCSFPGYLLDRCTPEDLALLKTDFEFAILEDHQGAHQEGQADNPCYQYIITQGKYLETFEQHRFYDLRSAKSSVK